LRSVTAKIVDRTAVAALCEIMLCFVVTKWRAGVEMPEDASRVLKLAEFAAEIDSRRDE
jgi:hypothetical protein